MFFSRSSKNDCCISLRFLDIKHLNIECILFNCSAETIFGEEKL